MAQSQSLNQTDATVFAQLVQRMLAEPDASISIFIVDMDDINKFLAQSGEHAGTAFLQGVAKLLVRMCGKNDKVCLIGDSTFGVVRTGLSSSVDRTLAAEKIIRLHDAAIHEMDVPFQTSPCIGIASYPDHSSSAEDLIHKAKLALETARLKEEPYFIYSTDMAETRSSE
jgi:diguanylate cyclase (GGDEF)-like protein